MSQKTDAFKDMTVALTELNGTMDGLHAEQSAEPSADWFMTMGLLKYQVDTFGLSLKQLTKLLKDEAAMLAKYGPK